MVFSCILDTIGFFPFQSPHCPLLSYCLQSYIVTTPNTLNTPIYKPTNIPAYSNHSSPPNNDMMHPNAPTPQCLAYDCRPDWPYEPHAACAIHDSHLCPRSGAFPLASPSRQEGKLLCITTGTPPKQEDKLLNGQVGHKPLQCTTRRVSHIEACVASQTVGSGS